ncbi:hypothetical protein CHINAEXTREME_02995 [Halobiforma lacisalsi AJ5]|uniref:DUF7310 domain-containing protein n=1 Tax=Natronobacterium lacisalsi AJ5 TaxID=358396 RepID=M0LNE3_NATLA|nr:hypothetical protein [Halobiforma lacisalsi]APW96799.1 hypothetical protein CHINAEXTREME_02995 [Halobiforma lacisalsi AJ5]EMA35072.1 hypothetical protein C445_06235 [Halobiforma lacisalsi AJ5]
MTDTERLERRLAAVERAVVDGDARVDELADLESALAAISDLEERLEEHERRLADLEGRTGSLEGFTGELRAVNEEVERQAAAAVAAVDRLERRLPASGDEDGDGHPDASTGQQDRTESDPDDESGRKRSATTARENPETSAAVGTERSTSTEPKAPERTAAAIVEGADATDEDDGQSQRDRDDAGTPSFPESAGRTWTGASADADESTVVPADQRSVDRRLEDGPSSNPGDVPKSRGSRNQDASATARSEPGTDDSDTSDDAATGLLAALRTKL